RKPHESPARDSTRRDCVCRAVASARDASCRAADGMTPLIARISARNFRSLKNVDVRLTPLNILIGPNGSGKTNLLNVLRFLATTARFDLSAALDGWGGFDHIQRQADDTGPVTITIEGRVTPYSSADVPDSYTLTLARRGRSLSRTEEFTFKRRG